MALYQIPKSKMDELTKKINHIQNKGADIIFNVGQEITVDHKFHNGRKIGIKCFEVEIEGKYKVDDWRFVGTIEHSESGNIIRAFDASLEGKIPDKYKTVGQECEHCHQIRDRKDTYLVYNEKTNTFKQVGRTCLRGYTGGLDAEKCALFSSVMMYIFELENPEEEYTSSGFWSGAYTVKTSSIKKEIFGYVKKNGYIPQETGRYLAQNLFVKSEEELPEASDAEIAEMDEWAKNLETKNDYMWNAKTAWNKQYAEYRDIALLASFVWTYLKDKAQRVVRAVKASNSEYVGNVGDKITIKDIKTIRVLYSKDGRRYSYYASDVDVLEIIDAQGHVYVWSTAQPYLGYDDAQTARVESIVATVKEHQDYRGVKQTVITRGKIIWKEDKPKTQVTSASETQSNAEPKKTLKDDVRDFLKSFED